MNRLCSNGLQLYSFSCDRMTLRHALVVADTEYQKQKKSSEDELDLDEDAVAEQELRMAHEIQ